MDDAEFSLFNIERFTSKINQLSLWGYFEIKLLAFRRFDNSEWKARFLFIKLMEIDGSGILIHLETSHFKLVNEIRSISELDSLLSEIVDNKNTTIIDGKVSMELITGKMKYEGIYQRTWSFPKDYGLNTSCFALIQVGTLSEEYSEVKRLFSNELIEYSNLGQAVRNVLGLDFWTESYSPSIVFLAPIHIKVINIQYNRQSISIQLDCSLNIAIDKLNVIVYKIDLQGNQIGKGEILKGFKRVEKSRNLVLNHPILLENHVTSLRLKIRYLQEELEEHSLHGSVRNMLWDSK